MKIPKPSLGRIVLVTLFNGLDDGGTVTRAAVVTSVHDNSAGTINAQVVLDGQNDRSVRVDVDTAKGSSPMVWSAPHNKKGEIPDGQAASWRWPDIVKEEVDVDA